MLTLVALDGSIQILSNLILNSIFSVLISFKPFLSNDISLIIKKNQVY